MTHVFTTCTSYFLPSYPRYAMTREHMILRAGQFYPDARESESFCVTLYTLEGHVLSCCITSCMQQFYPDARESESFCVTLCISACRSWRRRGCFITCQYGNVISVTHSEYTPKMDILIYTYPYIPNRHRRAHFAFNAFELRVSELRCFITCVTIARIVERSCQGTNVIVTWLLHCV